MSTLNHPPQNKKLLVMSGTRLNLTALRKPDSVSKRFGITPPTYPLLDLPFSAALDFLSLTYTVPVALAYKLN